MNQYKISVVIPTYNRQNSILAAIRSVLNQTYPVYEIIVADDCSTDNTEAVVRNINDSRIRYSRLPENKGAGGARNYGASLAEGEWIAFHDSDDEWLSEKIEHQIARLEELPDCKMVYSAYEVITLDGDMYVIPDMNNTVKKEGSILRELLEGNMIGAPTIMLSKEVFYETGGFDESLRCLEDWDFALNVASRYPIAFLPEIQLKVNQTEGSVSSKMGLFLQCSCAIIKKYYKYYVSENKLESVVQNLALRAERNGVLPLFEKMLSIYFS